MEVRPEAVPSPHAVELSRLAGRTREFLAAAKAESTRRAYRADWTHFETWCDKRGLASLPAAPETVAFYIADLAGSHKPATLRRRLTVISRAHQAVGHASPAGMQQPLVSETLKGIRRTKGTAQAGKRPLLTEQLRAMIRALPENLQGVRDRSLLLLGFAGGFRRSELAGLAVDDIRVEKDGLVITLRRSKTDQEGQGRKVAVPYGSHPETCPVRAYREWLEAAGIVNGAVFREIDRQGRLWIVDFTARVQAFSLDGKHLGITFQTPDYRDGRPSGLSVDPKGNVIVSDSHYHCVRVYTPDGELLRTVPLVFSQLT